MSDKSRRQTHRHRSPHSEAVESPSLRFHSQGNRKTLLSRSLGGEIPSQFETAYNRHVPRFARAL
jgi:hypothetical protein